MSPAGISLRLAVVALALSMLAPAADARLIDGVVAVVNGEPVTYSEIRDVVAEGLGIPAGDADLQLREEQDRGRIVKWIETIVESLLVRQELARLNQAVPEQDVDKAVESVRKANNLTEEQFREALTREGLSLEAYRRRLRWQIERGAIVRAKKLKEVTVTGEELRAFFQEESERFLAGAEIRLETLFIPLPPGSAAGNEKAAVASRIAAQKAAELLHQGRTMAETAALLSPAYPGVASIVSEWVKTEDLEAGIQREIRRLKTGETSAPFFTEAGGHILTVLGRRGGTPADYSAIRETLSEELTDRRSEKAMADILAELKKDASIDVRL